ncbi:rhamnan synthesis F family protein [Methylocapsa polymorpha]|uniref:Rhamnan synthesis F family protein n=1 Tax=Methylocapsa polymorpha TaxID=3080828 RepID=A0ABZ0HSG6_9HYPH|nr:rhamnan synthesis F family protein [Methylocapsa sp. RX1]
MRLIHIITYLGSLQASAFQWLLRHPKTAGKYIYKSGLFDYSWYLNQYSESQSSKLKLIEDYLYRAGGRSPHPLFDSIWYASTYADVKASKLDPLVHYLQIGARLGRSPSPLFDGRWYQDNYQDVKLAGANPLIHYLKHGWREGRNPHPLFDTKWYQEQSPAVRSSSLDPLTHYVTEGWRLGLSPHPLFDPKLYRKSYPKSAGLNPLLHYLLAGSHEPLLTHFLFDPAWYLLENQDVAKAGLPPLLHYLRSGWKEKRNPMQLFDAAWYLERYPDIAESGINPFLHYLKAGWTEKRSPHPLFDGKWYLEHYPDVARAEVNPLLHYLCVGWIEKRSPHPLFDAQWYLAQYPDIAQGRLNPLQHYVQSGWREARSPHPLFDSNWYLKQYPDVARAGLDPLRHYLASGWRENRNPGPFFNTSWYISNYNYKGDDCPLSYYLSLSKPNHQMPHPLFDADWYVNAYGPEIDTTVNCYVDYVTAGIDVGRLPNPHYDSILNFIGEIPDARSDAARNAFEKMLLIKGAEAKFRRIVEEQFGVLDTHYEVWQTPDTLEDKVVCLFGAYAPNGYLPRSTLYFLSALKRHGIAVIMIAATQNSGKPYADDAIECEGLISRDNFGFDFAGWALGLHLMPSIWRAHTIIFANDSIFGPLTEAAFGNLLERIRTSSADYVGLTESWQIEHHYQSYFFALKSNAIRHHGVKTFWRNIRSFDDKDQVIQRYEVKMLEVMTYLGLKSEVLFPVSSLSSKEDVNPTLDNWRDLIERGFPFVKVQVLRDDISGIDKAGWQRHVVIDPALKPLVMERLDSRIEQNRKAKIMRLGK